jgi:hypothetical protein
VEAAVSGDKNLIKEKTDKIIKYEDFTIEIKRMWNVKTDVVPVKIWAT